MFVFLILYIYIEVCLTVRRFHDLDRSGGDYFLLLVPLYNIFVAFELQFKKGTVGPNRFGADPLQPDLVAPGPYATSPYPISPASKDSTPQAYTIAPPALKEERNLILVYIAAAAILIAVGYFVYWSIQTSQRRPYFDDGEPGYISAAASIRLYENDSTFYEVSNFRYLSRESMLKLFSQLWDPAFSGTKQLKISAGAKAVLLDLDKGKYGTVLSVNRFCVIENIKNNLIDAGFREHPDPFIAPGEILETLQNKSFYEHDGRINMQVGTELAEIHHFINFLIADLLIIDRNSKLNVQYE